MKQLVINVLRLMNKCKEDNIGAYAAQTAFFLIMSLVPLVMFFITLLQYTPITEGMLLHWVNAYLPEYFAPICVTILDEVYTKSVGILSTSALIAIWTASKGVHYLSNGLDEVNGVTEKQIWLIQRLKAIVNTFLFMVSIIGVMLLIIFGHFLENVLTKYVPMVGVVISAILEVRILIITPLMVLTFLLIYHSFPSKKRIGEYRIRFRDQLPGAVLCTFAWYGLSVGISIYVGYFNGFSMYGSLTTIVLMMFWIYFCMYILLFCAEFNVCFYDSIEDYWERRKWK